MFESYFGKNQYQLLFPLNFEKNIDLLICKIGTYFENFWVSQVTMNKIVSQHIWSN